MCKDHTKCINFLQHKAVASSWAAFLSLAQCSWVGIEKNYFQHCYCTEIYREFPLTMHAYHTMCTVISNRLNSRISERNTVSPNKVQPTYEHFSDDFFFFLFLFIQLVKLNWNFYNENGLLFRCSFTVC